MIAAMNPVALVPRGMLTLLIAALLIAAAATSSHAVDPPAESAVYDKLVSQYMAGKWDDLEAQIKSSTRSPDTFSIAEQTDIDYITKALGECDPAWWKLLLAGRRTPVKASIFNVPVTAVFDPQQKSGLSAQFGDDRTFTLGWAPGELGSSKQAEHGFTKGELAAGGIWSELGMASGYAQASLSSLTSSSEAERLKLQRVLSFRGDLAATYYGNPRTRQWWLFLALQYYRPQYQKTPTVMSRKSLGAMFVAELASHPGDYPSIKLPTVQDADHAEEKLVSAVHDHIERHGWTLAEDKLIREATKSFALANASALHTGGPLKLANGKLISLEPRDDVALQSKRDQWLFEQLTKH
jgi:hypothetical protein